MILGTVGEHGGVHVGHKAERHGDIDLHASGSGATVLQIYGIENGLSGQCSYARSIYIIILLLTFAGFTGTVGLIVVVEVGYQCHIVAGHGKVELLRGADHAALLRPVAEGVVSVGVDMEVHQLAYCDAIIAAQVEAAAFGGTGL